MIAAIAWRSPPVAFGPIFAHAINVASLTMINPAPACGQNATVDLDRESRNQRGRREPDVGQLDTGRGDAVFGIGADNPVEARRAGR